MRVRVLIVLVLAMTMALPAQAELFNNWNKGGVDNGPTRVTQFRLTSPVLIRQIMNYHWNNGRGMAPGFIALYGSDGHIYGPWRASGTSGTGGAQNVNWIVHPDIVLPAGTYTVVDSDIQSWSHNSTSGGAGFTNVSGSDDAPAPQRATPSGKAPSPGGSADGTASLVTLRGDRDIVSNSEGMGGNNVPDAQLLVRFAGHGRMVNAVEVKNSAGPLAAWDTRPSNGWWQLGVVRNGIVINDSNGALKPFRAGDRETLDLYVHDIGALGGSQPFDVTIFFSDGSRQTIPLDKQGGRADKQKPSPGTGGGAPGAYFLTLQGDRDIVGGGEGMRGNGGRDAQIQLRFDGRGRTVNIIEILSKSGPFSAWDTRPGNGWWQMGVVRDGMVINDGNGALRPFVARSGEMLDLYVHDIGGLASRTPYDVNVYFSDGSKQTFNLIYR